MGLQLLKEGNKIKCIREKSAGASSGPAPYTVAPTSNTATPEPPSSWMSSSLHATWTTLIPLSQPLPDLSFSYNFTEDLCQQLLLVQTKALFVELLIRTAGGGLKSLPYSAHEAVKRQ